MSYIANPRGPLGQKGAPLRAPKLRAASRDASCTLRIPGHCCRDDARVVGCHIRIPGFCGTGQKPSDLFLIDACDCCHAVLDNRSLWADAEIGWDDVLRAFAMSLDRRERAGLITVGAA